MLSSTVITPVNRLLHQIKWIRDDLCVFSGKTVHIRIPPVIELKLQITTEGDIQPIDTIKNIDVRLTIAPLLLPGLLARSSSAFDAIKVAGDTLLAAQLISIGKQIDWTTVFAHNLSSITGDVPAHRIGYAGEWLLRWHADNIACISRLTGEYLIEERNYLTKNTPLRRFVTEVQTLQLDTQQIERRLARITQHVALRSTV